MCEIRLYKTGDMLNIFNGGVLFRGGISQLEADEEDGAYNFNGVDQDTDPWEKDQRRGSLLNPKIIS